MTFAFVTSTSMQADLWRLLGAASSSPRCRFAAVYRTRSDASKAVLEVA